MNVKMLLGACVTALLISPVAIAGSWGSQNSQGSPDKAWLAEVMSEPCMNGDLSGSGSYTTSVDSAIRLSHSAGAELD